MDFVFGFCIMMVLTDIIIIIIVIIDSTYVWAFVSD